MSTRLRCAIYTRKSTEEGLDQSFNSLDAQREACEAYILSQAGEGWECLADLYDDGGWSGGTMDRPALTRLLEDIGKGRVDVVVVYKVDRLTRSLMDFARIVETFDTHGTSFVSVTQAFNTTSSMGRLTLNVLLSFAQFEREVTGERIRDKIAASKARGMWMGGNVPLGYDLDDRKLVINPPEADVVRHIYRRYLELGSLSALARDLAREGIRTKCRISRQGKVRGGIAFTCGGLSLVLRNRIYLGEIVHNRRISHNGGKPVQETSVYPGNHDPILDQSLFDAVQQRLADNHHQRISRKTRAASCPLAGRIYDRDGQLMCPSFSYGRGKRMYRYYVSECLLPNGRVTEKSNRQGQRVPAGRIEVLLVKALSSLTSRALMPDRVLAAIARLVVEGQHLRISLDPAAFMQDATDLAMLLRRVQRDIDTEACIEGTRLHLTIEIPAMRRGQVVAAAGQSGDDREASADLAELLRTSHRKLAGLNASPLYPESHSNMRAPANDWTRTRIAIGLLAPDIQKAILQGCAPIHLQPEMLLSRNIPLDWNKQRIMFGMIK